MDNEIPFKVEYARTEHSKCKGCLTKIPAGSLRLARIFQSKLFDGNQSNWFHAHCFFDVHRPLSAGDFDGFETIRSMDQEYIRMEIDNSTQLVEYVVTQSKSGDGVMLEARMSKSALRDFGVEYAKSGRAKCRKCEININKEELRVKKIIYDSDVGMKFGGEPLWHHLICFVKARYELGWLGGGVQLPGFAKVHKSDQWIIEQLIRPILKRTDEKLPTVKLEANPVSPGRMKKLHLQNDTYFKFRDFCQRNLSRKEMVAILKMNRQDVPRGSYALLDALADALTFGALERCPKCSGQLYLRRSTFECRGYASEWARCNYCDAKPNRQPACVPPKIRAAHRFLDRDYPPRVRLFYNEKAKMSIQPVVKQSKEEMVA